ncbi:hypothetical protein [Streptomyces sp. NPDC056192]|uniref:hypothetical protein n=1 Tax=Streptomyces sp. NPDC056192 TaxID=3345743 RepID=UPI0035DC311A
MDRDEMDRNEQLARDLKAQLDRLRTFPGEHGGLWIAYASYSLTDGRGWCEVPISAKAVEALTEVVESLANHAGLDAAQPQTPAASDIDPLLEAEFEEYCIGLDTDFLMSMAAQDPHQAVAAFDEITREGEL